MARKKAQEPETVEATDTPETVEATDTPEVVVLKRQLVHDGKPYAEGTPLADVPNLHAGNIAFLRRVGTI